MDLESINRMYEEYQKDHTHVLDIETKLVNAKDEDEFLALLNEKSAYYRKRYEANKKNFEENLYPFLSGEKDLTKPVADAFFDNAVKMLLADTNDAMLGTDMFLKLIDFYKKIGDRNREIESRFYAGVTYSDRFYTKYNKIAWSYYASNLITSKEYNSIDNWETKKRVAFSYFNLLSNPDVSSDADMYEIIENYKKVDAFFREIDLVELGKHKEGLDTLLEETQMALLDAFYEAKCEPSKELITIFEKKMHLNEYSVDDITLPAQTYAAVVYYNVIKKYISISEGVNHLFEKYVADDKNIDYSAFMFYESDAYLYQMKYMQLIIGMIGKAGDTMKLSKIKERMLSDFEKLNVNVPYIGNNAYLDYDLTNILNRILKITADENKSIELVVEVLLRRNVMTYIHSTMVSQIAVLIAERLIEAKPELFYNLLKTKRRDEVHNQKDYLLDYIHKAALLHDIGKTRISDIINLQTRKLSDAEFDIIKDHPALGLDIISGTALENKFGDVVIGHHKWYNNENGYPLEANPKTSRKIIIDIITLADCIDAATDTLGRNYTNPKKLIPIVLAEFTSDDNSRYNKEVVDIIASSPKLLKDLDYITGDGRVSIYYNMYRNLKK